MDLLRNIFQLECSKCKVTVYKIHSQSVTILLPTGIASPICRKFLMGKVPAHPQHLIELLILGNIVTYNFIWLSLISKHQRGFLDTINFIPHT